MASGLPCIPVALVSFPRGRRGEHLVAEVAEVVAVFHASPEDAALENLLPVDLLLNCAACDEAVHHHILALPDAVRSVDALASAALNTPAAKAHTQRRRGEWVG